MKLMAPALLLFGLCASASELTKVKLDTVPRDFATWNGAMLTEPLSVSNYHFEVNKEKSRVRVVIEYTYRGEQSAHALGHGAQHH